MTKTLAVLALIAAAFTAAGCGGSDSKTLSSAELTTQASAICKQVTTQIAALESAKKYDQIVPTSQAALKKLKALKPPSSRKDAYQAYLDLQAQVVMELGPITGSLSAGDVTKAQQLATTAEPIDKQTDAAAKAAGLPACAGG